MNPWIWDQVSLELCQVHIQRAIKPERGCDGGYYLSNHSVQISVGRARDIKLLLTYVKNGLIVHQKCHVCMLQRGVGVKDSIVGLYNGS